jgi:hypothetical protein
MDLQQLNMHQSPITSEQELPIIQTSTDRQPLCMDGFAGNYNNCLRFLHHSVKPTVGVVKYDFSTWTLFPTNSLQAKGLAVKWSDSFEKRKDFVDKKVVIFFHLTMKTIRVEVKNKEQVLTQTVEKIQKPRYLTKTKVYSKYFTQPSNMSYTSNVQDVYSHENKV